MNLPWRLSGYSEKNQGDFQSPYFPTKFNQGMAENTLQVASFYAWLLDQIPWPVFERPVELVDIGSKNFYYVGALYYVLKKHCPDLRIRGLEGDTGRRYVDLFRRKDYAAYYVRHLNQVQGESVAHYQRANWLNYHWPKSPASRVVTNFFPFLFDDLSDAWGLPKRFFKPRVHLKKCLQTANYIVLAHQGLEEADHSRALLAELKTEILWSEVFQENDYVARKYPVHLFFLKGKRTG